MMNNTVSALKEELEKLESNADMSFSAMEASVEKIKKTVAGGACTWNDLGRTEEQFALLELQCLHYQLDSVVGACTKARNRVKSIAHGFKHGAYDGQSTAEAAAGVIKKMVAMGGMAWEDIGTTKEELNELLEKTKQ